MQAKILIVMAAALVAALMCAGACFAEEAPRWAKEIGTRNRAAAADAKFNELFKGSDGDFYKNGGELGEMATNFIYGDIYRRGVLTDKQRALITLSVLTVNQTLDELKAQGGEKGFLTQKSIFPAGLDGMYQSSPENRKHVAEYLASMCFGDFYTRGALDIKTREILTLCIISAQGGCESQVKSHVQANFNVGNDETTMIEAITQCLPYMGFPRTLNALGCVAEIAGQQK